jgi:hypothetical protein
MASKTTKTTTIDEPAAEPQATVEDTVDRRRLIYVNQRIKDAREELAQLHEERRQLKQLVRPA